MEFLQYGLAVFIVIASFGFFYRVLRPVGQPDFRLKDRVEEDRFLVKVGALAKNSREVKPRGAGLSLRVIKKQLRKAYRTIEQKAANGEECFGFEHWIFDNHYMLDERLALLKKELYKFFSLPHAGNAPRVYDFAEALVKSTDGYITHETLEKAVKTYCAESPFLHSEVLALKIALEYALLEYIAIFCAKSFRISTLQRKAREDAKKGRVDLSLLKYNSYADSLYNNSDEEKRRSIAKVAIYNGIEIETRQDSFHAFIASYRGQVESAIKTMHRLPELFNEKRLLTFSPIVKEMQRGGVLFEQLTSPTKFFYLGQVAKKAKKNRMSEIEWTRQAIDNAKEKKHDIAFEVLPKPKSKAAMRFYITGYLLLSAALSVLPAIFSSQFRIAAFFVSLPLSFIIVGVLLQTLISRFIPPRKLPSVDLGKVLLNESAREKARTTIVVPRLIAKAKEVKASFRHIETIIAANRNEIFSYCVLYDLLGAETETTENDDEILAACKECYENSPYKDRIILCVRKRKQVGGRYQGWERKRGSLIELNEYFLNNKTDAFRLILGENEMSNYIITLDCDSLTNCCLELVQLMMHPYNAEKSVLSLSMNSLPNEARGSAFANLFCGARGICNYSFVTQSIENDLFGSGNFTGKGIYRLKEFHEKVGRAFLDNRILSHDYIEGAFSGCADSGQSGLDDFPSSFGQFLARDLRWLRGDWQLLPFLARKAKNCDGERQKNPITPIAKFHVFSNLFRSLAPATTLALVVLALFAQSPWVLLIAALSPYVIFFLLSVRASILGHHLGFLKEFVRQVFLLLMLPGIAVYSLFAIFITLARLIRKKKLLEWKTFAHQTGGVSFIPAIIFAVGIGVGTFFLNQSIIFYIIAAAFLFGILLNLLFSLEKKEKVYENAEFASMLKAEFKKGYQFFVENQKAEYHFLPFDNVQVNDGIRIAERTSPTNIGFALIAHITAHTMCEIDEKTMENRISEIIGSIEKLEKWHGNLYNWIDIKKLDTLKPRYVSAVDSGNLLVALLLVYCAVKGKLKTRVNTLIENTKIEKLFDFDRGLFWIGFNADNSEMDQSHYDLLASEATTTYLTAIALGKIPHTSFSNLSRQAFKSFRKTVLSSWTGGAFEYLFTPLFLKGGKNTLLCKSNSNAAKVQIEWAKKQGLPVFGISESQYDKVDEYGFYQYKALGIPAVSLKEAKNPTVVAPYASILTLPYYPKAVHENFIALQKLGMGGQYGFYESIDCKNERIQKTFMAHHLGMAMTAICNYLHNNAMIKLLRNHAGIRASEMLLTECLEIKARKKPTYRRKISPPALPLAIFTKHRNSVPKVSLLSCGKYAAVNDERGSGYAVYDKVRLTRKRGSETVAVLDNREINLQSGVFTASFDGVNFSKAHDKFTSSVTIRPLASGNGEEKKIVLHNLSSSPLTFTIKSKIEPILRDNAGDIAHRAYSDLFLTSETHEKTGIPITYRKNAKEKIFVAYFADNMQNPVYNTCRRAYYNRGERALRVQTQAPEPVLSNHITLTVSPKSSEKISLFTLANDNKEKLFQEIVQIKEKSYLDSVSGNCAELMRHYHISSRISQKAAAILYPKHDIIKNTAISSLVNTTRPIVAFSLRGEEDLPKLKRRLMELKKLLKFDLRFHLYIVYSENQGYLMKMRGGIEEMLDELSIPLEMPMGNEIRLVNKNENEKTAQTILENSIRFTVHKSAAIEDKMLCVGKIYPNAVFKKEEDEFEIKKQLGFGGITKDYAFSVDISETPTPRPYSNIIANKYGGTIITESGGGYSFFDNAYKKKITRWSNDAVLDPCSEFVILTENSNTWSITKNPCHKKGANYKVIHGLGYSKFYTNYNGILASQTIFLAKNSFEKFYDILLENQTEDERKIDLLFALKPVLGDMLENTAHALDITIDESTNTLAIKNKVSSLCVFVHCSENILDYSNFRESFTDKNNSFVPFTKLENGAEIFPSVLSKISINPNQSYRLQFVISSSPQVDFSACDIELEEAKEYYASLSSIEIAGYSNDAILSRWLPKQVLCSRYFGRAGFYQAGGALGFRDQLQDCLALLFVDESLVRSHILASAARQFEKGDVLHWWHEPAIGVRTKITDDRLWLPYLTAEYIWKSGDRSILDERVPFLENQEIPLYQHDLYAAFEFTPHAKPLYDHCIKALEVSCDFGANGLNKMGTGDWNDAMDKIGQDGKGTSMFTSMLLYGCIHKFRPFMREGAVKDRLLVIAQKLKKAINAAYQNDRYIRAVTDEGRAIGVAYSEECEIDLLVQSWAVLSEAGEKEKRENALWTAGNHLVDEENGIVKLLSPPFDKMQDIGYIADYPKGVRENGGQYSHAACWYILALLKEGQVEKAWKAFSMISPLSHNETKERALKYGNEPYVLSADIYAGENVGQGGWSWYTGAASWYYKILIEEFLGIKIQGKRLYLSPQLPESVDKYDITLKFSDLRFNISIDNSKKTGKWKTKFDSTTVSSDSLDLTEHLASKRILVVRE